jgi:autotransporter translocation and assembly factor TamB
MTKKLLFVTTILLIAAFGLAAADVSGKYTWDQQGRGGNTVTVTLTLKQDGDKLSGNISQPGRNGNMESPISDAMISGDNVSFKVTRETPNGSFTTSYKGVVKGDTIDLEITRPAMGGGEAPPPVKVTAKKSTT